MKHPHITTMAYLTRKKKFDFFDKPKILGFTELSGWDYYNLDCAIWPTNPLGYKTESPNKKLNMIFVRDGYGVWSFIDHSRNVLYSEIYIKEHDDILTIFKQEQAKIAKNDLYNFLAKIFPYDIVNIIFTFHVHKQLTYYDIKKNLLSIKCMSKIATPNIGTNVHKVCSVLHNG
jgi:hypothetical protein